jgi:hypothetical protein
MANILDRYGIKEVADVTFYEINTKDDGSTEIGAPVLYLDTLKVSTIEQTAENAEARGGKGNAALISWDYGKEISVTLEDALYSAKSLALMFGDVDENGKPNTLTDGDMVTAKKIKKTVWKDQLKNGKVTINGKEVTLNTPTYYDANGSEVKGTDGAAPTSFAYATGDINLATGALQIDVSANGFPGTYYVTGDTYARSEATGKDEFFQFIIPKAKVLSESNTITLEAEGDPTVFSMNLKVLRPKDGIMMKLVQYAIADDTQTN